MPDKLKFTHRDEPNGPLYTADFSNGNTCCVTWDAQGQTLHTEYDAEVARSAIKEGNWVVGDATTQMELPL